MIDLSQMQLLVKTLIGVIITIDDVDNDTTIMQLKHMIYEKSQNIAERQRLIAFGIILDNRKTVSFYNIKDGCVLHLIITLSNDLIYEPDGSMKITIKTLTGKNIVLDDISNDTTIEQLQIMVRDKEGIPIEQQQIYMRNQNMGTSNKTIKLDKNQTIGYYNIEDGSVLNLTLKLGGGSKNYQTRRFEFIQEMVVNMKKNTFKKTVRHTDFISAAWMIYKKVAEGTKDTESIEIGSMELTENPDKYIIQAMNKPKKE
jgi:hypothetical protein